MKFTLLPAACVLAAVILISGQTRAGEDHDVQTVEKHAFKVVIADDESGSDVIKLDGDDLKIGESRQFITDSGKEVVVTRTEDGLDVTVDGESLDLPSFGDIDIDIDGAHDGAHSMMFFKTVEGGENVDVKKVIVKGGAHASHNMVFIGEDGKKVEIKGDGGEDGFHWVKKFHVGGDGEGPHIVKLHGSAGAVEHLKSSGALDSLTEEQREKVLKALESYGAGDGEPKMMVIELDEIHEHDHDHEH